MSELLKNFDNKFAAIFIALSSAMALILSLYPEYLQYNPLTVLLLCIAKFGPIFLIVYIATTISQVIRERIGGHKFDAGEHNVLSAFALAGLAVFMCLGFSKIIDAPLDPYLIYTMAAGGGIGYIAAGVNLGRKDKTEDSDSK